MDSVSVEYDTSDLDRALRALASGLDRAVTRAETDQATRTAGEIRAETPRRTGRLAATIRGGAGQVFYGGGLPYAGYIEGRTHAVAHATRGAPDAFYRACAQAAVNEVRRI
jgi:hypothetical protein